MATIEPFQFFGYTPWEMNFTHTTATGDTIDFIVRVSEPPSPDTAALLSFIAAVESDPDWHFNSGSVAKSGISQITP